MRASIPAVPITTAPVVQGFLVLGAFAVRWVKLLGRALKHRRDAATLAGMDEHMLADIGLTRSDVRDAVAVAPWGDPTALLRARALERRLARHGICYGLDRHVSAPSLAPESAFQAPPTDRPARFRA
jgi:uncharacterized protein YjiS (DUF1127 family)